MTDELRVRKMDLTTEDGQPVHLTYDKDSDDLEIVFEKAKATGTVHLTDNIVLRFDRGRQQALSLILLNFSHLTRLSELGQPSFPLTELDNLPDNLRQTVIQIITSAPVNRFLKVSLLYATPLQRVPIATIEPLPLAA